MTRPRFQWSAIAVISACGPLLLTGALLAGCTAAPSPVSFPARMKVEGPRLPTIEVVAPDRFFTSKVPGRIAGPVRLSEDGSVASLSVDIGGAQPVECRLFVTNLDLASGLITMSERAFEDLEERNGPIFAKRVERVASGAVDFSPQLALSWRYRAGSGVGLIKHRIASVGGRGVYCRHPETGYRETFAAMFESLVRNLRWDGQPGEPPSYESVTSLKVESKPSGVGSLVVTELDDGTVRSERRAAMLTSSAYGTLSSIDTVVVGFSRQDGTLINSVFARSEDGVLVTDLALDPSDDGWVVSGTLGGAAVGSEKAVNEPLLSVPGQARALRNALRTREASTSFEDHGWFPLLRPERPQRRVVVLGQRRDADHFHVISKIDSLVVESVVDTSGQTTWSRWVDERIGPIETELIRGRGRIDPERATASLARPG